MLKKARAWDIHIRHKVFKIVESSTIIKRPGKCICEFDFIIVTSSINIVNDMILFYFF